MIRAADLRKDWPWVRALLERAHDKTGEAWFVEDIYAAVANGRAAMFVSDEPEGVMVCHPDKEAWTGDPVLFVWVLCCPDGMERLAEECYALLDDLKAKVGAKAIIMDSPRAGWQKTGKWRVRKYIYEKV